MEAGTYGSISVLFFKRITKVERNLRCLLDEKLHLIGFRYLLKIKFTNYKFIYYTNIIILYEEHILCILYLMYF